MTNRNNCDYSILRVQAIKNWLDLNKQSDVLCAHKGCLRIFFDGGRIDLRVVIDEGLKTDK